MFIDHEIDQLLQLLYIEQNDADHKPIWQLCTEKENIINVVHICDTIC